MIVLRCFQLKLFCRELDGHIVSQLYFFGFISAKDPLVNSPNIDKQLLFHIGSPNCTLSTFPGDFAAAMCRVAAAM